MATLEGFEPSISTLKGWRAGPLHHRVMDQIRAPSIDCEPFRLAAQTPGTRTDTGLGHHYFRVTRHGQKTGSERIMITDRS
jgi:hypothetical protein